MLPYFQLVLWEYISRIFVLYTNTLFQDNSNESEVCKLAAILPGHDVFSVHTNGLKMLDAAVKYIRRSLTDVVTFISKYSQPFCILFDVNIIQ